MPCVALDIQHVAHAAFSDKLDADSKLRPSHPSVTRFSPPRARLIPRIY